MLDFIHTYFCFISTQVMTINQDTLANTIKLTTIDMKDMTITVSNLRGDKSDTKLIFMINK